MFDHDLTDARPRRVPALLLGLALAACLASPASGDEGFWPFNAVPKAAIKARYGFDVTDEWLKHLQLSSVLFDGSSGSFVSPDGLVLTNHHVGLDAVSKLSTPERDLVKHGFYAATQADELKAPDLELDVLQSVEEVTPTVNAAVTPRMSAGEAFAARRAAIATIEKDAQAATGLKSTVVTLYQGGLYHLYRYKRYTDVRLVFAPEFDTAFFGGDPDNFTYPRYCLDMMLFRVYEDGRPLKSEHYLKLSAAGAREGDLVFTSGHPGATQRLNTVAHLEYLRDTGIPLTLKLLETWHHAVEGYSARGDERARQAKDEIFTLENSLKSYRGQIAGLHEARLMGRKREFEQRLRTAVASDPKTREKYGDAWEAIAGARGALPGYLRQYQFLENWFNFSARHLSMARTLVRLAAENEKPDPQRLPEFTEARRPSLELSLYSPAPIYPAMEQAKLAAWLALARDELGADSPLVRTFLGGRTPEARAAELVGGTKLDEVAVRKQIAAGGRAAIESSEDSMIALARAVDADARAARKRYEDEVIGVERAAYAKIAQARFATEGAAAYPDGTSTLRLSFGAVKGYQEHGKAVAPFTTIAGLYERSTAHGGQPPYALAPRWIERKAALGLQTPYNYVTTNDIVGGNSGSPVVNRRGELVGLAFDGNIDSLVGYFIYDESDNRMIAVDVRAILEALRKVYGATRMVDELTGARAAASQGRGARNPATPWPAFEGLKVLREISEPVKKSP